MYDLTEVEYIAGAYIRLSKEDEKGYEESVSVTNQRNIINEYAKKNNIKIVEYYIDDGYSGSDFERPGFKRLINDIECGLINCVITKDTSRLGREFIETGNYMFKYFPEHNVRYIAILENFDTFSPNGVEDIIPFKTVINDMYLKDTSRKIKSTRHNLMKQGLFVGSSVPYGYKRSETDNRMFEIDEYAAGVVRNIFNLKLSGMSNGMIARQLTNEGILPPDVYKNKNFKKGYTANLWKTATVKRILANEVYIGNMIQGMYERVSLKSKKKKLLPRSKWIISKNTHEAIIDEELFKRANSKQNNLVKDDVRFRKYDYLLKGLVVCADCGRTMLVRRCKSASEKTKDSYRAIYCCRTYANYRNNVCSMHYFREDKLNQLVIDTIKEHLIKYANESKMLDQYDKTMSSSNLLQKYQFQLDEKEKKLVDIDKAISELYKDKVRGIISSEEFVSIKKDFERDKKSIEDEIYDLKVTIKKSNGNFMKDETRRKVINDFLQVKQPSKQLINDLVKKITIDENKNIKIYFNFQVDGEI